MAYDLEGQLLEVCTCKILCPCWVGENPDGDGTCDSIISWHIDKGHINGVNVAELTIATLNHIPGNVLKGNWRVIFFIDDKATPKQHDAMVAAFRGDLGGPLKDLAGLYGEIVSVERAPVLFDVAAGKGHLKIGDDLVAEMEPFKGATGQVTTLHDTAFSTIPGAPAYVSKAAYYRARNAALGFDINLKDHNAVQGKFTFRG